MLGERGFELVDRPLASFEVWLVVQPQVRTEVLQRAPRGVLSTRCPGTLIESDDAPLHESIPTPLDAHTASNPAFQARWLWRSVRSILDTDYCTMNTNLGAMSLMGGTSSIVSTLA